MLVVMASWGDICSQTHQVGHITYEHTFTCHSCLRKVGLEKRKIVLAPGTKCFSDVSLSDPYHNPMKVEDEGTEHRRP